VVAEEPGFDLGEIAAELDDEEIAVAEEPKMEVAIDNEDTADELVDDLIGEPEAVVEVESVEPAIEIAAELSDDSQVVVEAEQADSEPFDEETTTEQPPDTIVETEPEAQPEPPAVMATEAVEPQPSEEADLDDDETLTEIDSLLEVAELDETDTGEEEQFALDAEAAEEEIPETASVFPLPDVDVKVLARILASF
jgi:hypothetical protein